jgi:hypothetical protein
MSTDDENSEKVGVMDIVLARHSFSHKGVEGFLYFEGEEEAAFATIELPWLNNLAGRSCIPRGRYECVWRKSPRFGPCYHVLDVPGRSNILFHHGNYAGNRALGLKSDSSGCIILGVRHGVLGGQKAVVNSKFARTKFEMALDGAPFMLTVTER